MDRDGSAIVLDLTSGELVAFSGAVSYSKAADRAGSFYVIWNAQDQSASQHDNKLEVRYVQINLKILGLKYFKSTYQFIFSWCNLIFITETDDLQRLEKRLPHFYT